MTYTLDECIMKSTRLKRRQHVLEVLHNNDIFTHEDFMNRPVPIKNLWKSEVKTLCDMRSKELIIRDRKRNTAKSFYETLRHYASKHEASRIANILKANDIYSLSMLISTRPQIVKNLRGIGPKSFDILEHIRADQIISRHRTELQKALYY